MESLIGKLRFLELYSVVYTLNNRVFVIPRLARTTIPGLVSYLFITKYSIHSEYFQAT